MRIALALLAALAISAPLMVRPAKATTCTTTCYGSGSYRTCNTTCF